MTEYSLLGALYRIWLQSGAFRFLQACARPFSVAFRSSALVGLVLRPSAVERSYRESLFTRVVRGVMDALLYLPRRLFKALAPAADGSALLRVFSGSVLLRFDVLLGAFVFVMFCAPHAVWSNSYALAGAVLLLLLFGLMAAAGRRRLLYPGALGFPFLLFALACLMSLLFTRELSDSIRVLVFFFTAFLLALLIAAEVTDRRKLMTLLGFIYAAVMVTALYAVAQRIIGVKVNASFTDISHNRGVPGRVYSTLDNPNNYAEFLVLFTPLCAAFAANVKKRLLRLPLSLGLALPMLAMVMTYSRSSWLSILLAAAVFVYFSNRKLIPLLLFAALFAVPFLPQSVLVRISTLFNGGDSSTTHRIYTWQGILMLLADKGQWFTGIGAGPNTFQDVYPIYARRQAETGVFHSQMLYMELVLEFGALGFFSFMWLMLRTVKDAACAFRRTGDNAVRYALIAAASAFIGIAVGCVAEYIWYYPRVLFAYFILFGICLAAIRMTAWNGRLRHA